MQSYIKKSTLIREFGSLVKKKKRDIIEKLDAPFFQIINAIFKKKPQDIKFHITKENTLVFNIKMNDNTVIYLEHFYDKPPDTLITITGNTDDLMVTMHEDLELCLEAIYTTCH